MTVMDVKLTCATMGGGGRGGGGRWYWEEGAGNHYVPLDDSLRVSMTPAL